MGEELIEDVAVADAAKDWSTYAGACRHELRALRARVAELEAELDMRLAKATRDLDALAAERSRREAAEARAALGAAVATRLIEVGHDYDSHEHVSRCPGCLAMVAKWRAALSADPPAVVPRAEAANEAVTPMGHRVRVTPLAPDTHTGTRPWTGATSPSAVASVEREDCPHFGSTSVGYGLEVGGTVWGFCSDCRDELRRQLGTIECDEEHDDCVPRAELEAAQRELERLQVETRGHRHYRRERDEARAGAQVERERATLAEMEAGSLRNELAEAQAGAAALRSALGAVREDAHPSKRRAIDAALDSTADAARGWLPPDLAAEVETALERQQAITSGPWYYYGSDEPTARGERDHLAKMLREVCDVRDALLAKLRARREGR